MRYLIESSCDPARWAPKPSVVKCLARAHTVSKQEVWSENTESLWAPRRQDKAFLWKDIGLDWKRKGSFRKGRWTEKQEVTSIGTIKWSIRKVGT